MGEEKAGDRIGLGGEEKKEGENSIEAIPSLLLI